MGIFNHPFTWINNHSPLSNNASKAFARNYEDIVSHPVSSSTGGLFGGDSGVVDFSNAIHGAGVQNNSLQGGMSNKNNRYGVLAYGGYLGSSNLLGGESGAGATSGAEGIGSGAGAGGWQQYAKMGSSMGGMGGMGGGGGGGGTSPGTKSNEEMQRQTEELMKQQREQQQQAQQQLMIAELIRRYQNVS